jgi:hypothetical protein
VAGVPLLLRWYDRALRNRRDRVEPYYEEPVYAQADLAARWSGWDGWYVLMIPRQGDVPIKAIRVSMMTGLYGLDGIDNYQELQGLPAFNAVEYLMMIQTHDTSHLFRRYVPRQTDLAIRRDQLLVSVNDWGQISGRWPNYEIHMREPTADIDLSLTYAGKQLIWWADLPKLFTYFAAFGDMQGTIALDGREYTISGLGSFEHGFARKPFQYDQLLKPLRKLQSVFHFTLIHYHYNLLIGENGCYGGIMLAQGMGLDFRNLGGLYFPDGSFKRLDKIQIEYVEVEQLDSGDGTHAMAFPKRWVVRAEAEGGSLEYAGCRESPAARIASHMIYFDYRFAGIYRAAGVHDVPINGQGYGEFVGM